MLLLASTTLAGLGWLQWRGELTTANLVSVAAVAVAGTVAAFLHQRRSHGLAAEVAPQILADAVIDQAPALLVITDPRGRLIRYNKACADLSGYSMTELANPQLWRQFVPAEERASVARAIDVNSGEAFPRSNQNHWITKGGERRLLRWTCSDIRDRGGQLKAIVAAGLDITDLRHSESRSERAASALQRAHRIARLAHWTWLPERDIGPGIVDDSVGRYIYSAEAADIFEVTLETLNDGEDAAYAALIHPEDRDAAMQVYHDFLKGPGDQLSQDYRIRRANGDYRHIRVISEKLRDGNGDITELTGIVQDLTELRRAELAALQVQAILIAAHRLAGIGYWFWDESGFPLQSPNLPASRYRYSAEAQAVSGISEAEMRAIDTEQFCRRYVHENDRARVVATMLRFRSGNVDQYTLEYTYLHPTRGERILRSVAVRERDAAGNALHATGLILDITDMRRGELALRDKEYQLEAAHHLARLGYWSWLIEPQDDSGIIKSAIWSKEAATISGIDSASAEAAMLDGSFEHRFPHPDDRLRLMRALAELRDGRRQSYDLDYRLRRPDGSEIWLRSLAENIKDDQGRVVGAFGVIQDISERKNAEAGLRRAHQSLANAQRISHVGNWARVIATGEVTCSDEVYRIFGLEPGRTPFSVDLMLSYVHPEDRQRLIEDMERTVANPAPFQIEHRVVLADGSIKVVRQQGEAQLDSDGKLVRLEGIILDITDLKAREQALNQARIRAEMADRAKTEFLANMSHELRTPLNAVIGFSDVLAQQIMGPIPAAYAESIDAIRSSGRHLLEIIGDLLEMSRIESGDRYLQEFPFDVKAAIHDTARHFTAQAQRDGIALSVDETGRLPDLVGEERAFKQVLGNLLSNALKFTPRHGRVTITATSDADAGLLVAVSDTGKGIDPKLLPQLGKPFAQGESSLSRRYGGVGLGLAISRRLMHMHGGRLEITSAPGAGTRVIMIFPPERVLSENTR
ncbi:PAS domain-containing protein [Dongia rigui]|uniref:histidine kinase n=1 Tax=Dongia rigui TaxID=940149 RepID=A0ABU5E2E2_9PROT|nr:PAS domain-containing protein [Dongia rigui]MDY0873472.1 PAS domain-containing protein [Dongia rigui]